MKHTKYYFLIRDLRIENICLCLLNEKAQWNATTRRGHIVKNYFDGR